MMTNQIRSAFLTESSPKGFIYAFFQIVAASFFIGLCAQIQVPLYFTPVPLTGQTFAVMLIGAVMGSRKGALTVLLYLTEGFAGLPVFAGGGFGILNLIGPKGGYLLGWVVQAYLVGYFLERSNSFDCRKVTSVLLFSCVVQLGMGAMWLSQFVGVQNVLMMGVYPFIPGEVIKSLAIVTYLNTRKISGFSL